MLSIKACNIRYQDKVILNKIQFDVEKGVIQNLIGNNGTGKSTLLSAMNGEIFFDEMSILKDGKKVNPKNNYEIIMISSDFFGYEFLRSIEFIEYIGRLFRQDIKKSLAMADALMQELKMTEFRNILIKNLSQGTKQKLAYIAMIVTTCEIVLFDEAFEHIDEDSIRVIKEKLEVEKNKRYIFNVSHTKILNELDHADVDIEQIGGYS
ncbi:MAG: ATP-binding cassette domain-containing protein [Streptococcaceae bacterium]|jgi:ABC-type multidrug transport system ATPase subunit|nr:ATP-binding cassette domain-containing protein [Streptococcaceae bacterium]